MAPLPLLKLGGLFVKTIAKPLATRMKVEARKHPRFSGACIKIGQLTHQITSRLNVLASGYKVLGVSPLAEEEALARGINFLSESFVFFVAGSIIVIEYARSEASNALKTQQKAEEEAQFRNYLEEKFLSLSAEIRSLNNRLEQLESAVHQQEKEIHQMKNNPHDDEDATTTTTTTSKRDNTNTTASSFSLQRWFGWGK